MKEENRNPYSEVIAVLKLLDDEEKLEALPMEMLEVLKSKADPEYQPEYSKDISLDEQDLLPETLSILSWIAMKYWGAEVETPENAESNENSENQNIEENQSDSIVQSNITEEKQEENVEEVKEEIKETKEEDSALPVAYKDLKWYQKLKMKIIEFFNKLFKRKNKDAKNNEEEGNNTL